MNTTVYKYPIYAVPFQGVRLPTGAEILYVGVDPQDQPCVWAKVEPLAESTTRNIRVAGTGHELPGNKELQYIGTFTYYEGVWHVFEELESVQEGT